MTKVRSLLVGAAGAMLVVPLLGASLASATTGTAPVCRTSRAAHTNVMHMHTNVDTDCLPTGNNFETSIAVNPRDPANIVGAAINIVVSERNGQRVVSDTVEPHVSFDGGWTWATYRVDWGRTGAVDPSVAFDAAGTVYLAGASDPDIAVTHSTDGGRTWAQPSRVAAGSQSDQGGVFNDHPQLAAFDTGQVILTWIREVFGRGGNLVTAPVYAAVSHDGGLSWPRSHQISGSAPFCAGRQGGHACDQTFGNSVAVGRGGAVVTFQETYAEAPDAGSTLGRNTYLAVTVDPRSGVRTRGPSLIGPEYDGIIERDYPVSAQGLQTLHDSQFNLDSDGNVTVDPTDPTGRHFAVVWYDDRNAAHPVDPDPYRAVTNADIVVSQTFDRGRTWTAPLTITEPNDQFMPWAAYGNDGRLRVGYLDRSYDPANHKYGYTLATEVTAGSLRFSRFEVTTALSDPTRHDEIGRTVNPAFPQAAGSIGDYTGLAAGPTSVAAYWTDMRHTGCANGQCGHKQDTYFASVQ